MLNINFCLQAVQFLKAICSKDSLSSPLLSNRRCSWRHFSCGNFCTYFLTWRQTHNTPEHRNSILIITHKVVNLRHPTHKTQFLATWWISSPMCLYSGCMGLMGEPFFLNNLSLNHSQMVLSALRSIIKANGEKQSMMFFLTWFLWSFLIGQRDASSKKSVNGVNQSHRCYFFSLYHLSFSPTNTTAEKFVRKLFVGFLNGAQSRLFGTTLKCHLNSWWVPTLQSFQLLMIIAMLLILRHCEVQNMIKRSHMICWHAVSIKSFETYLLVRIGISWDQSC